MIYQHIFFDIKKRNEIETKIIGKVNMQKADLELLDKLPKDLSKFEKYFELKQIKNKIKITVKNEVIEDNQ